MIIYTVHIYYSKHGTSDIEHFEMAYSKGMPAQKKPIPSVSPPNKAR